MVKDSPLVNTVGENLSTQAKGGEKSPRNQFYAPADSHGKAGERMPAGGCGGWERRLR